jgi:Immunoglobulin I-set domain
VVTIAEAQAKDSGWYQCTAYNQSGSTATRARVQVEVPAKDMTVAPPVKLNIPQSGVDVENLFFFVSDAASVEKS